jgi:hypothetical protein
LDLRRRLQANPAKLVARVKQVQEEVAALKDLYRDLLTKKQVARSPPLPLNPKSPNPLAFDFPLR